MSEVITVDYCPMCGAEPVDGPEMLLSHQPRKGRAIGPFFVFKLCAPNCVTGYARLANILAMAAPTSLT